MISYWKHYLKLLESDNLLVVSRIVGPTFLLCGCYVKPWYHVLWENVILDEPHIIHTDYYSIFYCVHVNFEYKAIQNKSEFRGNSWTLKAIALSFSILMLLSTSCFNLKGLEEVFYCEADKDCFVFRWYIGIPMYVTLNSFGGRNW